MRLAGLVLVLALAFAPGLASARAIENCSRTEPSGERTLCHVAVIDAALGDVWALFTTTEGLHSWLAPVVAIDARVGGMWESSYDRTARIGDAGNIRNRVLAIVPERLVVIQIANAPPNFPHLDLARQLATTIEFESVDAGHTRVRVSMTGYRAGEGFDVLYGHFDRGNAYTLQMLAARVANGPTDWSAAQ